jgi:hypothetical protein
MNSWFQKYKLTTSSLILIGYLLTFCTGVFHYHNIEIIFLTSVETENNSTINHFLLNNGKVTDCVIHQNFSNIQTATTNQIIDYQSIELEKIIFSPVNDYISDCTGFLVNYSLRAPPQSSVFI